MVHAAAVPVIVEMPGLQGIGGAIGVEEPDALAASIADARIDHAIGAGGAQLRGQRLAGGVVVGVEDA